MVANSEARKRREERLEARWVPTPVGQRAPRFLRKYADDSWSVVDQAHRIAREWHTGQEYHDGSYLQMHLERVAARVVHLGDDAVAIALLHDVCEDTACTPHDLLYAGVPVGVVQSVIDLTHGDESYDAYIAELCVSGSYTALQVKKADLEQNISMAHLGTGRFQAMARDKWLPALAKVIQAMHERQHPGE